MTVHLLCHPEFVYVRHDNVWLHLPDDKMQLLALHSTVLDKSQFGMLVLSFDGEIIRDSNFTADVVVPQTVSEAPSMGMSY